MLDICADLAQFCGDDSSDDSSNDSSDDSSDDDGNTEGNGCKCKGKNDQPPPIDIAELFRRRHKRSLDSDEVHDSANHGYGDNFGKSPSKDGHNEQSEENDDGAEDQPMPYSDGGQDHKNNAHAAGNAGVHSSTVGSHVGTTTAGSSAGSDSSDSDDSDDDSDDDSSSDDGGCCGCRHAHHKKHHEKKCALNAKHMSNLVRGICPKTCKACRKIATDPGM